MNDNEETRSYTEIAAENTELRKQIDGYERAWAVAEAMVANNDKLSNVDDRARVYRATGKVVEVDVEFGAHMFDAGFRLAATTRSLQRDLKGKFLAAIEAWKAK